MEYLKSYRVSRSGVISSIRNGRIRKHVVGKDGYCRIVLSRNKEKRTCYVHRLVWEVYNGEIPDGMTINHKDMNKENNSIENLELVSHADNMAHARANRKWNYGSKPYEICRYRCDGSDVKFYRTYRECLDDGYDPGNVCNGLRSSKLRYGYIWVKASPYPRDESHTDRLEVGKFRYLNSEGRGMRTFSVVSDYYVS